MAGFTEASRRRFPLKNADSVVGLFRQQLEEEAEPNLALLSIVLGALENTLTSSRLLVGRQVPSQTQKRAPDAATSGAQAAAPAAASPAAESDASPCSADSRSSVGVPALQLSLVEALYEKFVTMVKGSVDLSNHMSQYTTVELLKKVTDVIWCALTRTFYKDRAHLQTMFTMLTESKLNCFGMAIGVIAACQILGLKDVHLVLTEDHAWAVFGDPADPQTAEITWHGKGSEDKRGQPVVRSAMKSWLYLTPIICTRQMEVAAMVTAINPAINSTTDSLDMAILQQKLLWILYDIGHLEKYPCALATLADIEDASPTASRLPSLTLYTKAVDCAVQHYNNSHVYPYTYLGNYHYRRSNFKDALKSWAKAAQVISRFNYSRDDEEVYKEFLEIANEMIPNVMKISSGDQSTAMAPTASDVPGEPASPNGLPLTGDPQCYAMVLQFYDGLCEWEEGSSTPVLHITWATHALYSLSRFDVNARTNVLLKSALGETEKSDTDDDTVDADHGKGKRSTDDGPRSGMKSRGRPSKRSSLHVIVGDKLPSADAKPSPASVGSDSCDDGAERKSNASDVQSGNELGTQTVDRGTVDPELQEGREPTENSPQGEVKRPRGRPPKRSSLLVVVADKLPTTEAKPSPSSVESEQSCDIEKRTTERTDDSEPKHSAGPDSQTLDDGTDTTAVGNSRGTPNGQDPTGNHQQSEVRRPRGRPSKRSLLEVTVTDKLPAAEGRPSPASVESEPCDDHDTRKMDTAEPEYITETPDEATAAENGTATVASEETPNKKDVESDNSDETFVLLRSEKMTAMKNLLVAERLNSGAIKLQMTAQSQVQLKHSRTATAAELSSPADYAAVAGIRKRIRRE